MLVSSHKKLRFRLDGFLVLAILMLVYSYCQYLLVFHTKLFFVTFEHMPASFFGLLQPTSVTSHICRCSDAG